MSRPKGIYLILIWFFISSSLQIRPLFQMTNNHNLNNNVLPPWLDVVILSLTIIIIILMIGLFKLEKFNIWVAIIFFGICTVIPIINMVLWNHKINHKVLLVGSILFIVPNILSIWYLLSKGFTKKSEDFRREKEKKIFMLKTS